MKEMRTHQMYHVLVNTSEIYQSKLQEMREIEDIYKFEELVKELNLILSIFREVCGLTSKIYGEIKSNEE